MEKDYLKDISEIRSIMERSSRFISLSGLSGIMAGIYALIGAYIAYEVAYAYETVGYTEQLVRSVRENVTILLLDALGVLSLAIITGVVLSKRKAKKLGLVFWDKNAQQLVINLLIPLAVGGALAVIFYKEGYIKFVAPMTLIFYGLGLLNASYFTYRDIRLLGLSEILLGLIACVYTGYGLYFWAAGFGLLHIIYGAVMYYKYER